MRHMLVGEREAILIALIVPYHPLLKRHLKTSFSAFEQFRKIALSYAR